MGGFFVDCKGAPGRQMGSRFALGQPLSQGSPELSPQLSSCPVQLILLSPATASFAQARVSLISFVEPGRGWQELLFHE